MEILFFTKKGDANAKIASEYLKQIYPETIIIFGERKDRFPEDIGLWKGDYIFSYLSPLLSDKTF